MPVRPTLLITLLAALAVQTTFAQNTPPSTSLKTSAQLVILDVVVTDSKQNAVNNLTASDFTISENNTPEHIKSFEEHSTAIATQPEPPLYLPPGNFTNYTSVPPNAPLNILLLDTLNTPNDAQIYVRNQLRLFLKTLLRTVFSPSLVSARVSGYCSHSPPIPGFSKPRLITSLRGLLR
jgi:hypothetical protein